MICLFAGMSVACVTAGNPAHAHELASAPIQEARGGDEQAARSMLQAARRAARLGDDGVAIEWCEEALGQPQVPDDLQFEIRRVLAASLARGGNPQRALELLRAIANDDRLPTVELRGARAAALDRTESTEAATEALAEWRALLPDSSVEASYAERRLRARLATLSRSQVAALAASAGGRDARACFRLGAGETVDGPVPGWVVRCQHLPSVVGVSLPRSGRLAGLAREHLAAASVAVRMLSSHREVRVLFEDSGSTEDTAVAAAGRLLRRGADWMVGPISAPQVRAAAGIGATVVIPGEPRRGGVGVAQTLENRLDALVNEAARRGARELFVLTPNNGYGRGVERVLSASSSAGLTVTVFMFEADGEGLSDSIADLMRKLRPSSAVLVADALTRVEFVVRQIRRREREDSRVVIFTTSEGLGPATLARASSAMEGDIFAPVVGPSPDVERFDEAFEAQEGRAPTDQARLVFRALRFAWSGGEDLGAGKVDPAAPATLYELKGGALVPLESQAP